MISVFLTPTKQYTLQTNEFVCNKFGLAEFFAAHAEHFLLRSGQRVLDVGCGAGPLGIFLADQYQCSVRGIEINPTACACCRANLAAFNLKTTCDVICEDFDSYVARDKVETWDLIISNPPIDESVSAETIQKFAGNNCGHLTPELFSYVTNSWHNAAGDDVMELMLRYARDHLTDNGRLLVVFCSISCASPESIIARAGVRGFSLERQLKGTIPAARLGVETFHRADVPTFALCFSKNNFP